MSRRTLLSSEQRTRLFGIPTDAAEMATHYVLGPDDLALVRAKRRREQPPWLRGPAVRAPLSRRPLDPWKRRPRRCSPSSRNQLGLRSDRCLPITPSGRDSPRSSVGTAAGPAPAQLPPGRLARLPASRRQRRMGDRSRRADRAGDARAFAGRGRAHPRRGSAGANWARRASARPQTGVPGPGGRPDRRHA